MTLAAFKARWSAFSSTNRGRRVLRLARWLFLVGILLYLAYDLTKIGWTEIAAALPTNPLFYLFFLLLYFLLPVAEIVLYRLTWMFDGWKSLPAFVKKRIYNKEVLGYSGEVYFYAWARKNIDRPDLDLLKTIRDQNIISSVASTTVALVLVAVFLYSGQIGITDLFGRQSAYYLAGAGVAAVVLVVLGILGVRVRKYVFSMSLKMSLLLFAVQSLRLVVGQALQIAQWAVAMPEVPLRVWFTYAALSIVISRIPVIPNRDLIFLGAGVSLSTAVQIPEAAVASMLVVITVLGKLLNLLLFAVVSLSGKEALPVDSDVRTKSAAREPKRVA